MFYQLLALLISTLAIAQSAPNSVSNISRIVGGQSVSISEHPYQVSIQLAFGMFYFHTCGGSLIKSDLVLSAAHCFYGSDGRQFAIRAGSSFSGRGGQFVRIHRVAYHPQYDPKTIDMDIALVFLNRPLTLNVNIQPIALIAAGAPYPEGSKGMISGWGALRYGGRPSTDLQHVVLPVVSQEACGVVYETLSENMFCAGFPEEGGRDSCQGDSGGPFVQVTEGGEKVLSGIVSWGYKCATPGFPGVYTRISALRSWIDQNVV